jgi:hypothetical protein
MARRRTQSPFLPRMRPLTNGDRHTDAGHVGVGSGVIPCQVSGGCGPPARGVGEREVRVPLEKPCSPGHCLGMFNDYMRTDMLRHVHQSLQARMDQRGTRSPLALLIESIEEVLGVFEGRQLFAGVGPNPFNRDPRYRWSTPGFRPETACHHDITLLQSQLGGLRELSAGLDSW